MEHASHVQLEREATLRNHVKCVNCLKLSWTMNVIGAHLVKQLMFKEVHVSHAHLWGERIVGLGGVYHVQSIHAGTVKDVHGAQEEALGDRGKLEENTLKMTNHIGYAKIELSGKCTKRSQGALGI